MPERYDWPLICLTHNHADDKWYATLYVKSRRVEGAYQFRFLYCDGFLSKEACEEYARTIFFANVDRNANHVVQLRLDCIFDWDGDGPPDPGPWYF